MARTERGPSPCPSRTNPLDEPSRDSNTNRVERTNNSMGYFLERGMTEGFSLRQTKPGIGLFSWYVLDRHGAGILLSVVFAMLILFVLRRTARRS
jgi:hypothetical protein